MYWHSMRQRMERLSEATGSGAIRSSNQAATSTAVLIVRERRSGYSYSNLASAPVCFAAHSSTHFLTSHHRHFTRPYRRFVEILYKRVTFFCTATRCKQWRPQKLHCVVCAYETSRVRCGSTRFASISMIPTKEVIKWA